jgi:hypothetical protein
MTDKQKRTPLALRIDSDLLASIDERVTDVNAQHPGPSISRTEWIEKALRWTLRNLPYGADGPEVREASAEAPLEVSGTYAMRMTAIEEHRITEEERQ